MNFKHHILIVLLLSICLFALWQRSSTVVSEPAPPVIDILHASFGLGCSAADNIPGIFPDNVKNQVIENCNGKLRCEIPIDWAFLGDLYSVQCFDKELIVEYRCAAFGQQHTDNAATGTLIINCTNPE